MTDMRQHSKYLLFVFFTVLIWAQNFATLHDQLHYHDCDDCRVCKVVSSVGDNVHVEEFTPPTNTKAEHLGHEIFETAFSKNRWEPSHSRAPPFFL